MSARANSHLKFGSRPTIGFWCMSSTDMFTGIVRILPLACTSIARVLPRYVRTSKNRDGLFSLPNLRVLFLHVFCSLHSLKMSVQQPHDVFFATAFMTKPCLCQGCFLEYD